MGKLVHLPKPVYDVKPFLYVISGFIAVVFGTSMIVQTGGILLGTIGLGFILNRMTSPRDWKNQS